MKLFLDDVREPHDCLQYMYKRIGAANLLYDNPDWIVVKSYPEFVKAVKKLKGKLSHVSFDHDLADGHYHKNMQEGTINYHSDDFNEDDYNKTGWHAAKYLKDMYNEEGIEYPVMFVHSMNPVGTQNIINLFK